MWISALLISILRLLLGASARFESTPDLSGQRIYFANHTSHIDTLAIMAALPKETRINTKPLAAADYWGKNRFLRYIATRGLNSVLINRHSKDGEDPLEPVRQVMAQGYSVIIFPEGTRRFQALPGEFKSGLYRLHKAFPQAHLVPIYLDNLYRSMPKGKHVPLPIICTIRIGDPLAVLENEEIGDFLNRAREAVVRLAQ
ncbi:acyltransferase [Stutzerimonas stutzeri]|uniref:Acyltransferase n=1 Tax=Stutzerimonas stutzeri TaxID=316 RepID=W8QU74_STUST|nr:lysophospholipid acyltransferase family protein [Stutzerimonas stutzeri]AHL73839.1 acyltransferase [Stutzerimonas stutzeri]MCQ4328642.1 1-acyl-sn-glycerol-3-phosphate acyltransferase [Stutzerimonas stutzeri]